MNSVPVAASLSTVEAVEVDLPVAGIGSRAYAFIIDWHIRALAALLVLFIVLQFDVHIGGGGDLASRFEAGIPSVLIYILYHPVLETWLAGRTPGKRFARLHVVTQDGQAAPPGAHLVRNLLRLLDSLPVCYAVGMVVMLFSRRQTRIGDMVAGTLVVFAEAETAAGLEQLANARVAPRLALLADELLRRWKDLDAADRLRLGRALLERAGVPVANDVDGRTVKSALAALLGNSVQ
jgi:uncharacterized RDD family membrane protein YckC